ncbi:MAG: two-component system, OmpR family, sensor kinase [Nocardioidaceae bacterium]|nr:two-component system, OmpR family, sensor kinase [Nocardioidaceae bacterium]
MSSSRPPDARAADHPVGLRRWVPRSLTARLVVTTLVLVAFVSVVVGVVTTLALRHFLLARLDDQLASATQRHEGGPHGGEPGPAVGLPCAVVRHGEPPGLGFGQAPGTLIGRFDTGCRSAVVVTQTGSLRKVDGSDVATLASLTPARDPRTVDLAIGSYRVVVRDDGGTLSVTGLPTADVSATIRSLALWESVVAVGGVLLAAVIGQALVRRQLTPLRQVATTANNVTHLPLESGEVGVIARVPPELTDPATEVGQVGAAFNAMLGHVEHALDTRHESEQRVRQFLADASHELRTPLSTIMGYAELTRRTSDDPVAMTHAMGRIQAESGRMAALVNDLLLLARLDSGRPLQRRDVDVSLLLAETVNDARVVSGDHVWRLTLPPDPLHLTGDLDRLHQVVSNLLANAIRHTPPGTTISVYAEPAPPQGHRPAGVLVRVHDDGPGMPPALAGKEFERFSRGDASRTRASGGSGLGLSIVQAIVAAHEGSVDIRSRPTDTTITIFLPSRGRSDP